MEKGKRVVLVGGCFDVLHPGHVVFLEKARQAGDELVVFLESDRKVRELKGKDRPVHSQKERATVLQALKAVNRVILLPYMIDEKDYDRMVLKVKPDIIAVTKGRGDLIYHRRAAKLVGAKIKFVTGTIGSHSTSRILGR